MRPLRGQTNPTVDASRGKMIIYRGFKKGTNMGDLGRRLGGVSQMVTRPFSRATKSRRQLGVYINATTGEGMLGGKKKTSINIKQRDNKY